MDRPAFGALSQGRTAGSNAAPDRGQIVARISSYPFVQRLKDADLLDDRILKQAARNWQSAQVNVSQFLTKGVGLRPETLKFFVTGPEAARLSGCRRLGDYLKAAALVTEAQILGVLAQFEEESHASIVRPLLGRALSQAGLIRQTTADYFARVYVNSTAQSSQSLAACMSQTASTKKVRPGDPDPVAQFCDWAYQQRAVIQAGGPNAAYIDRMLRDYPHDNRVRFWVARLGYRPR